MVVLHWLERIPLTTTVRLTVFHQCDVTYGDFINSLASCTQHDVSFPVFSMLVHDMRASEAYVDIERMSYSTNIDHTKSGLLNVDSVIRFTLNSKITFNLYEEGGAEEVHKQQLDSIDHLSHEQAFVRDEKVRSHTVSLSMPVHVIVLSLFSNCVC
jgi:hypothetical protein